MHKFLAIATLSAALASPFALAQQPQQLDPIFQVTPAAGQPDSGCFANAGDTRNPLWRGITSVPGQTIIGGLLGAAVGNQFGSGTGKDIATGVGTAIGASVGAANAHRQAEARVRDCQHYQAYSDNYNNAAYSQQPQTRGYRSRY